MDLSGLKHLWSVASSKKRNVNRQGDAGLDRQRDADLTEGIAVVGDGQDMAASMGGRGASFAR